MKLEEIMIKEIETQKDPFKRKAKLHLKKDFDILNRIILVCIANGNDLYKEKIHSSEVGWICVDITPIGKVTYLHYDIWIWNDTVDIHYTYGNKKKITNKEEF